MNLASDLWTSFYTLPVIMKTPTLLHLLENCKKYYSIWYFALRGTRDAYKITDL